MTEPRVIYDIGANAGDNIPYYLLKSDIVVAIEANPTLCEAIAKRFAAEINSGRLILQNCVVTTSSKLAYVDFYIHNSNHVLSRLSEPAADLLDGFNKVKLPSRSVLDVIAEVGQPYYVKIDIEGGDADVLKAILKEGIRPAFISAESHSIDVFSLLVSEGRYDAFKLVDGRSISKVYASRMVMNAHTGECVEYSFPFHSAGPFGNDINGDWMTADNFFRLLAFERLGWKDIHATNQEKANLSAAPSIRKYFIRFVRNGFKER